MKEKTTQYYTTDLTQVEKLKFSHIDEELNKTSINNIADLLESLNENIFFNVFHYYKLEVKATRNYYMNFVSEQTTALDLNQTLAGEIISDSGETESDINPFNASFYDISLSIPERFDFLFNMQNNKTKLMYDKSTSLVRCITSEIHLHFTPYGEWNYSNPMFTAPFYIVVNSLELPANCFLGSNKFGIESVPLISLGTLRKQSLNVSNEYVTFIPEGRALGQSISISIIDINQKKLPMREPSYIIGRLTF